MSSIDFSSFFGTSSTTTRSTSLSDMLGDYASIKNGSYGKLLKAYYKKQDSDYASSDEAKEANTKLTKLKSYSSELKNAASAINNESLFAEGNYQVTYKDGTKADSNYNLDKIYDKAKSFVDAYNTAIKSGASNEDDASISKRTLSLISYTKNNSALLSELGITTSSEEGKEGQLTIDEDKFKKGSVTAMKSLFTGSGSYAAVIENKAGVLSSLAESQMSKVSSYSSNGSYSSGSTASLSSLFNSEI